MFWGLKFEFQYFFFLGGGGGGGGGVKKNDFFLGGGGWYEDFVNIFWGSSQNWTVLMGSFLCNLGSFIKVKVGDGGIFGRLLKFLFFRGGGVLEIPDLF